MNKIKNYIYTGLLIMFITMLLAIHCLYTINKSLNNKLSISKENEKAYIAENDSLQNNNKVFLFKIDELNYNNDSIVKKLNEVRKTIKVKDKKIEQLQYLLSEAYKKDTIIFKDTLFKNESINIDTTIRNNWYKLNLSIKYPNIIFVSTSFKSEKYIITGYKKETINPPKKFFIAKWLQKKHNVLEVNIIENNPYIENKQQKFIKIIK